MGSPVFGAVASAIYRYKMTFSSVDKQRRYVVDTLARYWPRSVGVILSLPIPRVKELYQEPLPPQLKSVILPEWSARVGVDGKLLVPARFIIEGNDPAWTRTDWLGATFWYLSGSAERAFEGLNGPIHSYSFRLKGWDPRLWERAWANRIALFLRLWSAREQGTDEDTLFGPLPDPEIILTHDVDAVTKTMAIRLKQTAFHAFNASRSLFQGQLTASLNKFGTAGRFLFARGDYWHFDRIIELEEKYGVRSHFNIYGGLGGWRRSMKQLLLDPSYDVYNLELTQQLRKMHAGGWTIGLHQSFNAWSDAEAMREERIRLEQALDAPVTSCRQHWLRFSWEGTWKAQQEAGFLLDSTLGFNDRPAFRNSAALRFHPWDPGLGRPANLAALPMVLMDSHLYDYADLTEDQRLQQMVYWLDEIRLVRGTATLIWHQRVMSPDYGWEVGFRQFLEFLGELSDKRHE